MLNTHIWVSNGKEKHAALLLVLGESTSEIEWSSTNRKEWVDNDRIEPMFDFEGHRSRRRTSVQGYVSPGTSHRRSGKRTKSDKIGADDLHTKKPTKKAKGSTKSEKETNLGRREPDQNTTRRSDRLEKIDYDLPDKKLSRGAKAPSGRLEKTTGSPKMAENTACTGTQRGDRREKHVKEREDMVVADQIPDKKREAEPQAGNSHYGPEVERISERKDDEKEKPLESPQISANASAPEVAKEGQPHQEQVLMAREALGEEKLLHEHVAPAPEVVEEEMEQEGEPRAPGVAREEDLQREHIAPQLVAGEKDLQKEHFRSLEDFAKEEHLNLEDALMAKDEQEFKDWLAGQRFKCSSVQEHLLVCQWQLRKCGGRRGYRSACSTFVNLSEETSLSQEQLAAMSLCQFKKVAFHMLDCGLSAWTALLKDRQKYQKQQRQQL